MKQFKLYLLGTFVLFLIASSCSVQKRHYMGGYHIEWKKHSLAFKHISPEAKHRNSISGPDRQKTITEDVTEHKKVSTTAYNSETGQNKNSSATSETGAHHKVHVLAQVSPVERAGSDLAKQNSAPSQKTKTEKQASDTGGKNQAVALVLAIFLGWVGVHRFYLGYNLMGILYIFTLGLFTIGWIIDVILLIIPNGLTPKDRTSYDE